MKKSGIHKTYKGKIDPNALKNPRKYNGDVNNIIYRSMWEKYVMHWLDENPNVEEWASEELFFPYDHPVTGKRSKYYPDFFVKMIDGVVRIVEVKPLNQITRPQEPKRRTQKYINEVATWAVNQEKWKSARYYCQKNNLNFEIWSENTLNEMGIMKSPSKSLSESKRKTKPKTQKTSRTRPKRKS